jgi:hypothetical protein
MRVPLCLMLGALLLMAVTWVTVVATASDNLAAASPTHTGSTVAEEFPVTPYEEPLDIDPPEQTLFELPPEFPNAEQLRIIGRIAEGIYKERTMKGHTPYFFCGEAYKGEEAKDLATEVAYHVVKAAWEASTDDQELNVWGWAGTLLNEGGMDICTLGMNPRKAAYLLGILEPRRLTVSHTKEDVLRAINHDKMKSLFKTYDLGMGQTLDSHYKRWMRMEGKPCKPEDLLEWEGFYWQAKYMHSLAVKFNTDRPWMYWPGYRAPWKDFRVTQHAKKLGAKPEEIGAVTPGNHKKPQNYGRAQVLISL